MIDWSVERVGIPISGLVILFLSSTILAAQPTIQYVAPDSCPQREEFIADVLHRVRSSGRPDRQLNVEIAKQGDAFVGRLAWADDLEHVRVIQGVSCNEVASALSLLASLAIELEPTKSLDSLPATVSLPAPSFHNSASSVPASSSAGALPAPSFGSSSPAPEDQAKLPDPWRYQVGAMAVLQPMVGPHLELAITPFVGAEVPPLGGMQVRVSGMMVRGEAETQGKSAELRLTALQVDTCPVKATLSSPVTFLTCAFLQAGVLDATGVNVHDSQEEARAWLAMGGIARLEWQPFSVLVVQVQGGFSIPAYRQRFYVDPDITLYQMPTIGGVAGVGLGMDVELP
jgi:hypothetical protein